MKILNNLVDVAIKIPHQMMDELVYMYVSEATNYKYVTSKDPPHYEIIKRKLNHLIYGKQ